jgi:hypothetical protein
MEAVAYSESHHDDLEQNLAIIAREGGLKPQDFVGLKSLPRPSSYPHLLNVAPLGLFLYNLVLLAFLGLRMKSLTYSARYRRYGPFIPASTENKE